MNTELHNAFINALLANSCYVDGFARGDQGAALAAKLRLSLTQPLADYVGQNFSVVTQFTDPSTLGGFSVTVFEDRSTGQRYSSFRGMELTLPGSDVFSAANILFFEGLAHGQTIAMINWYLRAITAPGTPVIQLFKTTHNDGAGRVLNDTFKGTGTGELLGSGPLMLDGHSLGGHLATVFARLFPENVASISTYNGLGVGRLLPDVLLRPIEDALGLGRTSFPTIVSNYYAEHGINVATSDLLVAQLGTRIPIFNEQAGKETLNSAPNHFIYKLTDALALYDVIGMIDANLSLQTATNILNAVSASPVSSLETGLDILRRLFLKATDITLIGDADRTPASRIDYHQKLAELRAHLGTLAGANLQLVSLVGQPVTLTQANGNIAYRYALRELNPFAIPGANYSAHNQQGQLNLYSASTGVGMTEKYLADRAEFLRWKNINFTADGNVTLRSDRDENYAFENRDAAGKTNLSLTVVGNLAAGGNPGAVANPVKVVFGNATADVVTGGILGDRLYGDAGTDWLEGKAGNDYLEGGKGLDIYNYNAFSGLLPGNDGADVIRDTDGKGVLRYVFREGATNNSTAIAEASVKLNDTQWQSTDGKFTYTKTPNNQGRIDLVVTINGDAGGSLTLKDWREGDFAIRLREARANPQTLGDTIFGDRVPRDFDAATPGIQSQLDAIGNVIVTAEVEANRDDALFGNRPTTVADATAPGEKFEAGGGNDVIFSDRPRGGADNGLGNADWVIAGAGRDEIETGAGNDFIEAGADGILDGQAGGDIADGGTGDDELYAESKVTLATAIRAGNEAAPTNLKGDLLSGAAGADWIVGDRSNDLLLGGGGEDLIVGGAGDDTIRGDVDLDTYSRGWQVERSVTVGAGGGNTYVTRVLGATVVDSAAGAADVIYAGAGADWSFGGAGDDFIDAGAGEDVSFGEGGADILIGGAGNDVLSGDNPGVVAAADEGGDYLDGGAGNDELFGNGGADVLVGGPGNDLLQGGAGKDLYVFNRGDGVDTIIDLPAGANDPDASVLVLGEGISRGDIKFRRGSLLIDLGPSDPAAPNAPRDLIHFEGFDPDAPLFTPVLDSIRFADGQVMTYQDVLAQGFDLDGTEGDDVIEGTAVTDRIDARGGNDRVIAKAGNDTVLGGEGNDTLFGEGGDDALSGGEGADRLEGGAGADTLAGGGGNDTLDGGPGDDRLEGGEGADTYLLGFGAGRDTLIEEGAGPSVISLAPGLAFRHLAPVRSDDDLLLRIRGTEDGVVLKSYFTAAHDWQLRTTAGEVKAVGDFLLEPDPYASDRVREAWEGFENRIKTRFDAGFAGAAIPQGANTFLQRGREVTLSFTGSGTRIEFFRINQPTSALAATTITWNTASGSVTPYVETTSTLRFDTIASDAAFISSQSMGFEQSQSSFPAAATLSWGQAFSNTFATLTSIGLWSQFDPVLNQQVVIGHTKAYSTTRSGQVLAAVQAVAPIGVGEVVPDANQAAAGFLQGEVASNRLRVNQVNQLSTQVIEEIVAGPGNNTIQFDFPLPIALVDAGPGDDTINGQLYPFRSAPSPQVGDFLYGNAGNDTIRGGFNNDVLIGGLGDDRLDGRAGADTYLVFPEHQGFDLIDDSDNSVTFEGENGINSQYMDWYYNSIAIPDWRDRLLFGGELPPLPRIAANDYAALEPFFASGVIELDTVEFAAGISLADLQLSWGQENTPASPGVPLPGSGGFPSPLPAPGGGAQVSFDALEISWAPGSSVRILIPPTESDANFSAFFGDPLYTGGSIGTGIERFRFAGGTVLSMAQMLALAPPAPWLNPQDGSVINGTPANDTLTGGSGNDTYLINAGGGVDRIIDSGGVDTLSFGPGITPEMLTLGLGSLLIRIGGSGDAIHIEGFDPGDALGSPVIENFRFTDGTTLTYAQLIARGFDFIGTAGDDTLAGTSVADRLDGLAGNDLLAGGAGSDTYLFSRSSGQDIIEDLDITGLDTDTVRVGDGVTPGDVNVTRSGDFITLVIRDTQDRLAVRWQPQAGYQIERVDFADGTVWGAAILEALAGNGQSNTAPPLANPVADPDAGEVLTLTDPGLGSVAQPITDPGGPTLSEHFTPDNVVSDEEVNTFAQLLNDPNFPDMMQAPPTPAIAAGSSNGSVTALTAGSHESASVETADRLGSRERFEALVEQWFDEARRSAPIDLSRIDQIIHGLDGQASGERLEERSGAPDDIVRAWRQTRELLGEHLAREPVAALGYDSADLATALTFSAYGPSQGGISSSAFPSVAQPSGYYLRQFGGLAEGLNQIAA